MRKFSAEIAFLSLASEFLYEKQRNAPAIAGLSVIISVGYKQFETLPAQAGAVRNNLISDEREYYANWNNQRAIAQRSTRSGDTENG
ncbi:hypothetical protein EH228_01080 [Erwinia endophytica]|uniref:hypothetical protein n=1 Tax=Erwinia endophytica TaxID=1563158 RepID=UPI001265D9FF|nr:hypothetical protein [Erwinia endophytica]KAB8313670.1 hypothetical protein EH228_01080 [Erwinia endophytica]